MGFTNFPHGVTSFGTPVMGSGSPTRFYGWWGNTNWFVDNSYGSDDHTGKEPTRAFQNLKKALDVAAAGDVIYIRPKDVVSTDTDPAAITPATAANWLTTRSQFNLAIIGAGPQIGSGQVHMTYLKGHADVTTATLNSSVLTVKGPYTTVENLAFHRGGSTRAQLEFYGDGTSTNNAWGSSAYNCLFRFHNNSTYGAVYIPDSWYCGIYNSHFYENQVGVLTHGSQSTFREGHIAHNIFDGLATTVDAHIVFLGSNGRYPLVYGNYFNSGIPAKSGGSYGVYIHTPALATSASGLIAQNFFAIDNAASDITEGTLVIRAGNWDGSGEVET